MTWIHVKGCYLQKFRRKAQIVPNSRTHITYLDPWMRISHGAFLLRGKRGLARNNLLNYNLFELNCQDIHQIQCFLFLFFLAPMRLLTCQDWMRKRANNFSVGGRRGEILLFQTETPPWENMKKSEFICLILPLLAPMQNLEGGSQRGDDPEKSSSTADGAAKPRQKCLTVHDETWARHTHCFVEDYHYRCFRHSWKKCVTWIFLSFTTLCDFDLTSEYLDEITSFVVVNLFFPKYLYSELFIIGKGMTTLFKLQLCKGTCPLRGGVPP